MLGVKSESSQETWEKPVEQKEEPNFEVSGVLAEAQNQMNGVALNFAISIDAAKPDGTSQDWRLFEFLGESNPRIIKLHNRSCFLFGSDKRLLEDNSDDLSFTLVAHDSCSKQHAVIQFRSRQGSVKPYMLDLDSTNKTYLNGDTVEAGRYIELRHEDVIRFGRCESEYVLMNAFLDT
jgi:smad nuclear-interacting protein 1